MIIAFDNSYARLPDRFHARLDPQPVEAPRLLALNEGLARMLGLDAGWLSSPEGLAMLSGNGMPQGAEPLAQAYAGHQFGGWVPQLGDGRAILIGEIIGTDGKRRDIQLKGSGRTPFSRGGDGRAWLGPVLREYIVSEAMHALGIPTTRALAAVETGELILREDGPLPGAVLTRIASSHIRIGTFQYFAARQDGEALRLLAAHALERHYPERAAAAGNPALALLEGVVERQARLIADWMRVGFIHGVMNTDNMLVSGETIDYGPCAFMDSYHPRTVFSSIDRQGRYAFANQPGIAQWNLAQLASSLLPLIASDQEQGVELAQGAIDRFAELFNGHMAAMLRVKLGLTEAQEGDDGLAQGLLQAMAESGADHTRVFRALSHLPGEGGPSTDEAVRAEFADPTAFDRWAEGWRARLASEGSGDAERQARMQAANPAYVPRNHGIEAVIAAALQGDLAPFHEINAVLSRPYEEQPGREAYAAAPTEAQVVHATFCGT
ncbi:MAG: YdiU family protein [Notoacmeibacter sp.]|nr:YdiU family protein [Notoacmeibacter sp.]MCC0033408.1 YdiU family protein [Brucellaceae bacterium]